MDPVSVFGLISGGVQVAQAIVSTIHGLNQLRGRFQDADLTIRSLIQELNCIDAALASLREWARLNGNSGALPEEYIRDLAVAMDGCRVIMEVVSHDVSTLVQGSREDAIMGIRTRIRVIWNEETMRGHQEKLHSQVMALQLLLQVCQCHNSTEQIRLLRTATTRQIFHRVADDTATILSSRGSRATSYAGSISQSSRQSTSDSDFDFRRAIAESPAYRRALDPTALASISLDQHQPPIAESDHSPFNFTDGGYASVRTDSLRLEVPSLNIPAQRPEPEGYFPLPSSPSGPVRHPTAPLHSRSVSHSQVPQQPAPNIRRNASDSKAHKARTSGSRRERLTSFLGMSTRSRANLAVSPGISPNPSTSSGSLRRRQRLDADLNTSIDLDAKHAASVPEIIKAAQTGSRDEVERLIEQGCDIEARHSRTNRNALLVAAHCGNDDVVDLLIQNHAKLNVIDRERCTALHLSASRGHRGVLEILLEESRDLIEVPNSDGQTALRVAADFGQLETVYMLLAYHAQVNARAENQMTALHAAARRGDSEIIQMLISHGADLEAKDVNMMRALHHACEEGHLEAINVLLDNRATIEAPGRDHKTPLICAAEAGRSQAVKLLLKRKATSRGVDEEGMTALHWAAYNGHEETVSILSEKRGSLDAVNKMGRTALHLATIQSRFAVVDFLQRKGMPLDRMCSTGHTALHYACMADSFEITRLLLTTGADIEASETQHLQRPLHIAAARGSVPILELLCERGAKLDSRNGVGDRPACVASRFGHVGAVQKLLDRGSPLSSRFETGSREDSLLCLAALGGHWAVASLLLARGASIVKKDETGWTPARYAVYYGHTDILQMFLSSNRIPEANLPAIFQMPETIGFAPGVSQERKVEVQQLLRQSLRNQAPVQAQPSVPASIPSQTIGPDPVPGQYISQSQISTPAPAAAAAPPPLPASIPTATPSRRDQADNIISNTYTSQFPFPVESGGNTVFELSGSLDREPVEDNQHASAQIQRTNIPGQTPSTSSATATIRDTARETALLGRRVDTPEMRHPEPTQPLSNDRIAALLHTREVSPLPQPQSHSHHSTLSTSTSSSSQPQPKHSDPPPRLSATYTPVSFIYNPTPPPAQSYTRATSQDRRIPSNTKDIAPNPNPTVPPPPPMVERSRGVESVPRSMPTYGHVGSGNGNRAGAGVDAELRGDEQDSDSDSDSISSVYTAPEGDDVDSVTDFGTGSATTRITGGISESVQGHTS